MTGSVSFFFTGCSSLRGAFLESGSGCGITLMSFGDAGGIFRDSGGMVLLTPAGSTSQPNALANISAVLIRAQSLSGFCSIPS